jgi:hypothetical protein
LRGRRDAIAPARADLRRRQPPTRPEPERRLVRTRSENGDKMNADRSEEGRRRATETTRTSTSWTAGRLSVLILVECDERQR